MANKLSQEKQILTLSLLTEGSSIRSVERITGIHRDTIMRLGVRAGQYCHRLLDEIMRDLPCKELQLDEIWGFVGKKQRYITRNDKPGYGDAWTFVAIDADTRLVPAFHVGRRSSKDANIFLKDLAGRMINRVQVSTDGLNAYVEAVELGFGTEVDYAQVIKTYSITKHHHEGKYSPPVIASIVKESITGSPMVSKISTSYVERQNLTMRMHCRRLTRLTNAFSKKLENFKAAIALHFAYYNLIRIHKTIQVTPAMAAGIEDRIWSVKDIVDRIN